MLITIAIPTFNNESTISKAIDSCINQISENEVELLVVNNNSSDKTSEILKRYENSGKLRVVTNNTTVTLFENHNVCLKNALGKYVLYCHSDDELDPNAIKIIKHQLDVRQYPEKYVLWGHSLFRDFSSSLTSSGFRVGELFAGSVAVKPFLLGGLTPSGTCYSRNFIDYGGFLPTSLRITPSDSTSMMLLALNGFRFEMMEEIIFYRRAASTLTSLHSEKDMYESWVDAFEIFRKKMGDEVFINLAQQASSIKGFPLNFYCYLIQVHPKSGLKLLIKKLFRNISVLRSGRLIRSIFKAIVKL